MSNQNSDKLTTYYYKYQPLWKSIPIEPVEVSTGLFVSNKLDMYNTREEEGAVKGEVQAKTLRGAKMKVSRMFPVEGKWEIGYDPHRAPGVDYFRCHVKDNQNRLYLWEKEDECDN